MDCSCVYTSDTDSMVCLIREGIQKARKGHKCDECYKNIIPGERYEYIFGTLDGDLFIHKTCLDCLSLRKAFFCGAWIYGELWDSLWGHIVECEGEILGPQMMELTPLARNKVCDEVEEYWEREEEEEG
ncbi:hypothetical protein LCGC14_2447640 [marine sediment metagenome]|uniref:Uncharacterized protein n=1 Tax=marine sediment metagenome TaxID=412755 RepID=A0A0F9EB07_9ZZZZ